METGQQIRFTNQSRYGDWNKGDQGRIERVLATPPLNQNTIYIVSLFVDGAGVQEVWATDKDVEPWDQLSLF